MSDFRCLPPVMRVASLLRLLFPLGLLVSFTLFPISNQWFSPQSRMYASRVAVIAINLGVVGMICTHVVQTYRLRFRQLDSGPFPLETWQSQVRAIVLPAALAICALVLAAVIPPSSHAFWIVFPMSIAGAVLALVFRLDARQPGSRRLTRTPPPWQSG